MRTPAKPPPYPTNSFNYLRRVAEHETNGVPHDSIEATVKLKIIIVGAGVGGLATAIALKTAGHDVTVFESTPVLSEIGAGIQIPPNSARILHSWGLESELQQKSARPKSLVWKRWENGKVISRTQYQPCFMDWFGAPYYVTHRAHLHQVLHHKVVELGVDVRLAARIAKYRPDEPGIELMDGTVARADLVVAADGIKSMARRTLLGDGSMKLRSHGIAAYRATVPVEDMMANENIASTVHSDSLNMWCGDKAHVMSYAMAGGKLWNLVSTVPEPNEPDTWDPKESTDVDKLRAMFQGWDPALTSILAMVKETTKWPIQDIIVPDRWTSDNKRMLLLGDAAHAMIPFMSIGAAMAVEDASALAESLRLMTDKTELTRAVTTWETVRLRRVKLIHDASWLHEFTCHLPDGPEQRARDAAMEAEVRGEHFIESPNQWSDPVTQHFAYAYDPVVEVREVWKRES